MIEKNLIDMLKKENKKELEGLSTFVHGGLCAGHLLGLFYNLKRKNYADAAIHGVVAVYDCLSTLYHYKEAKK